ncbi:MAG: DUF547 domain-containing protein [Hyphomicrobiaceae bacterium]|nr:DUF547 domain-containing protein [Hyphomicrobiaceae bacterium]
MFASSARIGRRAAIALTVAAFAAIAHPAVAQTTADPDAAFDALLKRYVVVSPDGVNRVDYAKWKAAAADVTVLDGYIAELAKRTPSKMAKPEAFAYWGNLYNAITLKVILDKYPVASIRDIKGGSWLNPKAYTGPWSVERVTVENRKLSLDNIEHDIMRPTFKDPRVHYAVNCASFGCPNLMNRALRAATLDADLNAAARAFINHPRGVMVLPSGGLKVSSIYKWFVTDFGGNDEGLIAHFKAFADPALAQRLATTPKIAEDGYDWSLNATMPASRS